MDYRPVQSDRLTAFRDLLSYAFTPERGHLSGEATEWPGADEGIWHRRGVFEDETLLVCCRHAEFRGRVRGETLPIAGLAAVASPPEHRRKGLVRRLLAASLAEYRDWGAHLAALWPFEHSFYARYGWGTSNTYSTYDIPVDGLAFARARSNDTGSFVRLSPDDWARLDEVYSVWGRNYGLSIDRSEAWWRERVLRGRDAEPYIYGVERGGDLRAYLVYRFRRGDDGRYLRVKDMAYVDHDAQMELLRFLAGHDSQVSRVHLTGPTDTMLLDLVPDPGRIEMTVHPGPMIRLVDVRAAMEALPFPDVTGELVLHVDDPMATWNDGTFAVRFNDGTTRLDRTTDDPDVRVDIATLSQLFVGYRSVTELAAIGHLRPETEAATTVLDAAFPPEPVFLTERY